MSSTAAEPGRPAPATVTARPVTDSPVKPVDDLVGEPAPPR